MSFPKQFGFDLQLLPMESQLHLYVSEIRDTDFTGPYLHTSSLDAFRNEKS